MTRLTRPTAIGSVCATLLALGFGGFGSWMGLAVGALGTVMVVVGLHRDTDRLLSLGAVGLFAGALLAGIDGATAPVLLVAVTCSVLAWDLGGYAIEIERRLGEHARTNRAEIVHATGSVAVGTLTIGVGYGMYVSGSGGQPLSALLFLLVAAFLLIAALR